MTMPSAHSLRRSFRHIIAAGMTALYLAVICGPLASSATQSSGSAPVVMRECTGDCNLCGCSPESRAAKTCCCAKKRQQQALIHDNDEQDVPNCCKKEQREKKETVIACGCPCGSGEQAALSADETSDVLPFYFTELFSTTHSGTTFTNPARQLTSRHNDPPQPPPKTLLHHPATPTSL